MTQRRILPQRRPTITFEAEHVASGKPTRFQVSVGYLDKLDGVPVEPKPVEVFISGTKAGSEVEATARDGAVLLSIALQFGVPLDVMRGAITRDASGAPSSIIGAVVDQIAESPCTTLTQRDSRRSRWLQIAREEIAKLQQSTNGSSDIPRSAVEP
jgi:ribonucleoside-diphosphate reductase alpha chain